MSSDGPDNPYMQILAKLLDQLSDTAWTAFSLWFHNSPGPLPPSDIGEIEGIALTIGAHIFVRFVPKYLWSHPSLFARSADPKLSKGVRERNYRDITLGRSPCCRGDSDFTEPVVAKCDVYRSSCLRRAFFPSLHRSSVEVYGRHAPISNRIDNHCHLVPNPWKHHSQRTTGIIAMSG